MYMTHCSFIKKETLADWFCQNYDEKQLFFLWHSILHFEDAEKDSDIKGIPTFTKNREEIKEFVTEKFS